MTTTTERMDTLEATTDTNESQDQSSTITTQPTATTKTEIQKGWLEIAEKLLIQIALNKYKREEAALKLDMSLKTLLKRRYTYGLDKYPGLPSHDEIHELLELLPRTAIETYLLRYPDA